MAKYRIVEMVSGTITHEVMASSLEEARDKLYNGVTTVIEDDSRDQGEIISVELVDD